MLAVPGSGDGANNSADACDLLLSCSHEATYIFAWASFSFRRLFGALLASLRVFPEWPATRVQSD